LERWKSEIELAGARRNMWIEEEKEAESYVRAARTAWRTTCCLLLFNIIPFCISLLPLRTHQWKQEMEGMGMGVM
jgi:hypothetical protein